MRVTGTIEWSDFSAALFDLDGVLTPTAEVHMRAWEVMFNEFLAGWDGEGDTSPYTERDYFDHVDGKPRYDGVRDFLAARGIALPEGTDDDTAQADTVRGLGLRKNDAFTAVLDAEGVTAYPGSIALLDHLATLPIRLAVVSSSANAPAVLASAGLADRFETVVSGTVAHRLGLPGKPAPDTFLHAAQVLDADAASSVVIEDAVSGVRAGAAGDFGAVIGVDRGVGADQLASAGATLVVDDLAALVPGTDATREENR